MYYRIFEGKKAKLKNGSSYYSFECDPDDIDKAYKLLAENVILNNQDPNSKDLISFQYLADDDVETMLKDAKKQGFISDYERSNEMNELEKAITLLTNRKIKLKDVADRTNIPYTTIRSFVVKPSKLVNSAWFTVYKLAKLYDEINKL